MFIIAFYLAFSMLLVLWFDGTRYIIPNWLVASLAVLYPVAVAMARQPVDWKMALVGMAIVFAVGYLVFLRNWMGGGDIKLLTVCALWVGLHNLPDFLFMVAMIGGVFSILVIVGRKFEPYLTREGRMVPRLLRHNEPIPYGVAIALGFLVMLWSAKVPVLVMG